jgi:NADP-dependent 3-hydroxy acid dehydrogenase YdfG
VRPAAFSLEGKRVLVTGASSGIGRETAIACAREGATVVATGRNEERLAATLASLAGNRHAMVSGDLRSADDRKAIVATSGMLNGVVHCAGTTGVRLFRQVDAKYIDEDFAINFEAPVLLTQALLATRQVAQGGSIVFVGSFASHIGAKGSSIYSASKGALIPAARALAQEVGAKQQIRGERHQCVVRRDADGGQAEGRCPREGESLVAAPSGRDFRPTWQMASYSWSRMPHVGSPARSCVSTVDLGARFLTHERTPCLPLFGCWQACAHHRRFRRTWIGHGGGVRTKWRNRRCMRP